MAYASGEITVDKKEFLTDITERYNRGNRGNK